MASIADTYVTVLPETSKIADGIKRAFREVDADARAAGVRWKKEIDVGLRDTKIKVDADTGKAKAEIAEAARDRKMNIKVDVDKRGLYEGIAALEGAKFGMTGLGAAAQGTTRAVAGAGESLSTLARPAGIAAVVSLSAAFVELAGVAAAAAQAILLVPAAIGGIGAGVGTLFVGLSGVKDAWDAIGKASKSAGDDQASKANEVAAATRSVISATRSLNSAIISERNAQQDVARARKDARQALEDLNLELRGGAIDQKQAELDARKARQDLATGMFETAVDYEQAQLRVIEADQRVAEATQRNARLQDTANDKRAKGVDQADAVVAAEERAAQAHENTAAAQESVVTAQEKLTEANNKVSTAAKAAADALAGLSPNAQAALLAVQGLMPAFDQLKIATQDALFAGVGQQLTDLATTYLPMVEQLLTGIAGAMNQMLTGVTSQLMTPETMSAMQEFMTNVVTAFQNLAPAMAPLTGAFAELMRVGSTFLPELATAAANLAIKFGDFITKASESGDLEKWLREGLDTIKQLAKIAWNLVEAFMSLAPTAKDVLPDIVRLSENLRDMTPKIAETIKQYAPDLKTVNQVMGTILKTADLVKGAIDTWKASIDGFKIALTAGIDFLIGKVNALIDAFNRIPLLPNVPHVAAPSATVPGTPVMPTVPVPGSDQQAPPGAQAQRRGDQPARAGVLQEGGLQPAALETGRALVQMFPQLQTIGGVRKDSLPYHPSGRALDVMIPGGDTTGGANPSGKALGDQIKAWAMANADNIGLEDVIWQDFWQPAKGQGHSLNRKGQGPTQAHMDHVHLTFKDGTTVNVGAATAAPEAAAASTPATPRVAAQNLPDTPVAAPGAATTQHGPTGAPGDPLNIVLDPNIPANQRKTKKDDAASTFGQDFAGGVAEFLGFDGSLFKNPADFGLMKILGGLSKVKVRGADDATIRATGGGGGGILDLARSFIPQPFGALVPGSPTNAPAPGQPLQAGGGGLDFRMPKGPAPGPGVVDRSIHMEGSSFGYSPTQVQDQMNAVQIVQARPTLRNLPN